MFTLITAYQGCKIAECDPARHFPCTLLQTSFCDQSVNSPTPRAKVACRVIKLSPTHTLLANFKVGLSRVAGKIACKYANHSKLSALHCYLFFSLSSHKTLTNQHRLIIIKYGYDYFFA